jgi:hypothetical protein
MPDAYLEALLGSPVLGSDGLGHDDGDDERLGAVAVDEDVAYVLAAGEDSLEPLGTRRGKQRSEKT